MLRKVYFPKHVLLIINAYAELSRSRTLLDFPKYVRKFKYKRNAHAFLWIRETITQNIREGSETAIAPFFSIYFIEFYQSWPGIGANKLQRSLVLMTFIIREPDFPPLYLPKACPPKFCALSTKFTSLKKFFLPKKTFLPLSKMGRTSLSSGRVLDTPAPNPNTKHTSLQTYICILVDSIIKICKTALHSEQHSSTHKLSGRDAKFYFF